MGHSIVALAEGSALVTGWFNTSATFGPGEPNQTVLTSAGSYDVFVARYNANGTLAWVKRAGGSGSAGGRSIAMLSDGSMLVSGQFSESATFGAGEPHQTILTSAGENDFFVAKYNADGTLEWVTQAGGSRDDYYSSIAALSDGSALVAGYFQGSATFGPGEPHQTILTSAGWEDIFIARYNANGTLAWAKRAGGSGWDFGSSIAVLSDGSALVTGNFSDMAIFGAGEPHQTILTSAGGYDIFIAHYNADGILKSVTQAGGGHRDIAHSIAALSDGSALITGCFNLTTIFGPGEPNQTIFSSVGSDDLFIAKYDHTSLATNGWEIYH